jgi:hypothetical protein
MGLFKRQDIQSVNIKAEQLAGLSQTLFEYHDKLDHFQLKAICALVYDSLVIFMTGPKKKRK